jgi:hypothetical protein
VLECDKYILSRHGSFIGFGYLCNGMIMLNLEVPFSDNSVCMVESKSNTNLSKSELWHARLGHVHFKRIKEMSKMSLIPAINLDNEKCHVCKLNKITKKPFMLKITRESKILYIYMKL